MTEDSVIDVEVGMRLDMLAVLRFPGEGNLIEQVEKNVNCDSWRRRSMAFWK